MYRVRIVHQLETNKKEAIASYWWMLMESNQTKQLSQQGYSLRRVHSGINIQ